MSVSRATILGQLLLVGLSEDRWTCALERFLRQVCPGGILLSARHLRHPESTAALLQKLSLALPVPPFLVLEEEGGALDPLRAFFPPLVSPQTAAQRGAAARLGELAGAAQRLLGFNTNLAPLLDLSTPSTKNFPVTRAFSADGLEVAQSGEAFARGLARHKILPCAKYFPGCGNAARRAQARPLPVAKTMAELWREDLVPYRLLLPHLCLVMVGHSAYKSFDYDLPRPASLSESVVGGLLRVKLAYRGVAVTDDLDTDLIRRRTDLGEAAVRSIRAGSDLLFVGGGENSAEEALAALDKGCESGRISPRRVEEALGRLRLAKKGLALPSGKISNRAFVQLARDFEDLSKQCRSREQKIA